MRGRKPEWGGELRLTRGRGRKPARPDRSRILKEVEVGIDRSIFRLGDVGGMDDIEDGLWRQLVLNHGR